MEGQADADTCPLMIFFRLKNRADGMTMHESRRECASGSRIPSEAGARSRRAGEADSEKERRIQKRLNERGEKRRRATVSICRPTLHSRRGRRRERERERERERGGTRISKNRSTTFQHSSRRRVSFESPDPNPARFPLLFSPSY